MSLLILPRRFRQQPQRIVSIDWDNPITQNLSFSFNAGAGVLDAVTNTNGTTSAGSGSNPFTVETAFGLSRKYTSGSANEDYWPNISNASGVKSFACLCSYSSVPGIDGLFLKGGFNNGWGFKANSGGAMRLVAAGSSVVTDSAAIVANKLYLFVGVFDDANSYLYKNGVLVGSGSNAGTASTVGLNLCIGKDESVGTGSNANVYGAWVWDKALTLDEITAFSDNPWQILRFPIRRIWIGIPSAGGSTTNKTLAASIGSSPFIVRSVGAIRSAQIVTLANALKSINTTKSATQPSTASVKRNIGVIRSTTQGSAPTSTKQIGAVRTATQASMATVSRVVGVIRSASITTASIIARAISFNKTATQGSAGSVSKAVSKTYSASSTLAASISTIKAKLLMLMASIGQSAQVSKSIAAVRNASVSMPGTMQKVISKTWAASTTLSALLIAIKVKILVLTASIGQSASKVLSVNVVRGAAINSSVSIKRAIAATRTGAIVTNAAAVKAISKAFNATISQIASIIATTGGAASFIVGNVNVFHIQARSYIAEIPKRSATALIAARAYIYKIIKK